MAGAYLAIGSAFSALTKNQVIAFVLTAVVCLIFTVSGTPLVLNFFTGWAPANMVEVVSNLSFISNFEAISKGVIDLVGVVYFASVISLFLFANVLLINLYKAR
jgi:ABC-2 type transport system permease protein